MVRAFGIGMIKTLNAKESDMTNANNKQFDNPRSKPDVREMLRDIGYVLWLTKKLSAEIQENKPQLVRPEMAEFCGYEALAF
jgi:hypothetical protein